MLDSLCCWVSSVLQSQFENLGVYDFSFFLPIRQFLGDGLKECLSVAVGCIHHVMSLICFILFLLIVFLVKMINFVQLFIVIFAFLDMSELAVLRYDVADDDVGGCDVNHYLSVISPRDFSVRFDFDLPFPKSQNQTVVGSSCGGLLHLHDFNGQSLVCNLSTKQMKLLPPPKLKCDPDSVVFTGVGFGYDASSEDFIVIRNYSEHYESEEAYESGIHRYLGDEEHTQLYSFNSDSWKEIESPESSIISHSGVYVEKMNSIYWTVLNDDETTSGIVEVLSFRLDTERFDNYPLPPTTILDPVYDLLKYRGALGAVTYDREENPSSSMEIWKCNNIFRWNILYSVPLSSVDRPVGLWKEQFVFLDGKSSTFDDNCGQLKVYDLHSGELNELSIYSYPNHMRVFSYAKIEREDLIHDATNMRYTQYTLFSN